MYICIYTQTQYALATSVYTSYSLACVYVYIICTLLVRDLLFIAEKLKTQKHSHENIRFCTSVPCVAQYGMPGFCVFTRNPGIR